MFKKYKKFKTLKKDSFIEVIKYSVRVKDLKICFDGTYFSQQENLRTYISI